MLSNFPKIIQKHLSGLPQDDYPVLNSFLFVSCWLSFVLDQSQSSMRDLFFRLNTRGIDVDISTFSKASKNRDLKCFEAILNDLKKELNKRVEPGKLALFPLDSTVISLTSKLLWEQDYHQVKLFSGLNLLNAEPGGIVVHFGNGHDSKYGNETIDATPENGVSVMDTPFPPEDCIYC